MSFLTGKVGREELDELVDGWLVGAGDGKRLSEYTSTFLKHFIVWCRELDGMDGAKERELLKALVAQGLL